jgi:hypothetical protein
MPRRPYKPRMYIVACQRCTRWYSVPTRAAQAEAKQRGSCMQCIKEQTGRLEVFKKLLQCSMEDITKRASSLPENQREVYRRLYRKRQRAWLAAQERLDLLAHDAGGVVVAFGTNEMGRHQ